MADPIAPGRTDTFEQSYGEAAALGEQTIVTSRGDIETADAPGLSTLLIDHPDQSLSRVGVLLYAPGPDANTAGKGMIAQMTANEARTIAASLVRLAERLEPGSTH